MAVYEGTYDGGSAPAESTKTHPKAELKFKFGSSTNPETTLNRAGTKEALKNKESPFSPELRADYKQYLSGHLNRLIRLEQTLPPREFKRLYGARGEHRYDKMLFDKYTKLPREGAGTGLREVDEGELEKFIDTDRGMGIAYMLRQAEFELESVGDAVYLSMEPQPEAPGVIEGRSTPKSPGGLLRRGVEAGQRWWREPIRRVDGRPNPAQGGLVRPETRGEAVRNLSTLAAIQGTAGADVGGAIGRAIAGVRGEAVGMAIGGGVGVLATPVEALIARSLREGESLDVVQCARTMLSIDQNSTEARWLKEFAGVDIRDYQVVTNPDGRLVIEMNPDRAPETLSQRQERTDRLIGHAEALLAFQEANGIAREQRSPSSLARLTNDHENFSQTGSDIDQRVMRHFNINRRGEASIDAAGNLQFRERYNATTRAWEPNPNFDPNEMDVEGNIQRYRTAYRKAMIEEINLAFKEIRDAGTDYKGDLISELATKESKGGANDPANVARLREIERELGTAENKGPLADGGSDDLEIQRLSGGLGGLQEKLQQIDEDERKRRSLRRRVTTSAVGGPVTDLRASINAITRAPAGGVTPPSIWVDGVEVTSLVQRRRQLEQEIENELGTWRGRNDPPDAPDPLPTTPPPDRRTMEAHQKLQAEYRKELSKYRDREEQERNRIRNSADFKLEQNEIDTDAANLHEILTELSALDKTIRRSRSDLVLRDASNTTRNEAEARIGEMQAAMANPLLSAIPTADLANRSIEELLQQINASYVAGPPPVGWEAEDNLDPDNRNLLMQAKVEARVRMVAPPTPDYQAAVDPNIWGLSDYDLIVMDTAGIRDLMTERSRTFVPPTGVAPLPAVPNDNDIDAIRALASARFAERQGALLEISEMRERQKKALEREQTRRLTPEGETIPQIVGIRRYIDRYGKMDNELKKVNMDEFLSTDIVDRAGNPADANSYADYENGTSKAYVQMMRLMFDHTMDTKAEFNRQAGEQAAFARNQTIVSEAQLYRELNRHFNLRAADFNQAVTRMRNRFRQGTLSQEDLRYFFTQVMIYGNNNDGFIRQQIKTY